MTYIDTELDELSKEDFYRLKKVLNNKKRDAEIENDLKALLNKDKEVKDY